MMILTREILSSLKQDADDKGSYSMFQISISVVSNHGRASTPKRASGITNR
jgi:hypothetical protein